MTYKQAIKFYDRFTFFQESEKFKRMEIHTISESMKFGELMVKLKHTDRSWAMPMLTKDN
jgi:hypothetical protein